MGASLQSLHALTPTTEPPWPKKHRMLRPRWKAQQKQTGATTRKPL